MWKENNVVSSVCRVYNYGNKYIKQLLTVIYSYKVVKESQKDIHVCRSTFLNNCLYSLDFINSTIIASVQIELRSSV